MNQNLWLTHIAACAKITDSRGFCGIYSPLKANLWPSETAVGFQQITWHADDRTLHNHCCEYFNTYMIMMQYECEIVLPLEAYLKTEMILFTETYETGNR
jgi:hypothetical protein